MPFYNYECSDCGAIEKKFHAIGEIPDPCTSCDSHNLVKKIGSIVVSSKHSEKMTAKNNIENFIKDSRQNLDLMKEESKRREK